MCGCDKKLTMLSPKYQDGGFIDSKRRFTDNDYQRLIDSGEFKATKGESFWVIRKVNGGDALGKYNPDKEYLYILGKKDLSNKLVAWLQQNSFVNNEEYFKLGKGGELKIIPVPAVGSWVQNRITKTKAKVWDIDPTGKMKLEDMFGNKDQTWRPMKEWKKIAVPEKELKEIKEFMAKDFSKMKNGGSVSEPYAKGKMVDGVIIVDANAEFNDNPLFYIWSEYPTYKKMEKGYLMYSYEFYTDKNKNKYLVVSDLKDVNEQEINNLIIKKNADDSGWGMARNVDSFVEGADVDDYQHWLEAISLKGGEIKEFELVANPSYPYQNILNRWLEDNDKSGLRYKLAVLLLSGEKEPDEVLGIKDDSRYARMLRSLDSISANSKHEGAWRTQNYTLYEAEGWAAESLKEKFILQKKCVLEQKYDIGGAVDIKGKALVLVISSSNPLSTQLKKLTGDSFNANDFEDLYDGEPLIIKHKKSNGVFVVFTLRYISQVDDNVIKDDLSWAKNTYNISDFDYSHTDKIKFADGGGVNDLRGSIKSLEKAGYNVESRMFGGWSVGKVGEGDTHKFNDKQLIDFAKKNIFADGGGVDKDNSNYAIIGYNKAQGGTSQNKGFQYAVDMAASINAGHELGENRIIVKGDLLWVNARVKGVKLENGEKIYYGAYEHEYFTPKQLDYLRSIMIKENADNYKKFDFNKINEYADGGGVDDYKKILGSVEVIFENPEYNYSTNVSGLTTEQQAREYFVGKSFNVAPYPKEIMAKCIDIKYHEKGTYKTGGTVGDFENHLDELYKKAGNNVYGALELYAGELGIYNVYYGEKVDFNKKSKHKNAQIYLESKYLMPKPKSGISTFVSDLKANRKTFKKRK